MHFSDLEAVQQQVNKAVHYQADEKRNDYWQSAVTFGDCEDFALRKLHELHARGWPIEQLRLATAVLHQGTKSVRHAVLVVTDVTDPGNGYTGNYVLDNAADHIYQPSSVDSETFKWDKIQSIGGSRTWVNFDLQ